MTGSNMIRVGFLNNHNMLAPYSNHYKIKPLIKKQFKKIQKKRKLIIFRLRI